MNAMTNAMKEAGIKTPTVRYRIWNWLKDHPEKTCEDITKALGSTYPLDTQIGDMYKRGMLTVYKEPSRKTNVTGAHPMVGRYSVANPKAYELLPLPKTEKKKVVVDVSRAPTIKKLVEESAAVATPPKKTAKVELTEAEKFAAFLEFKALMKEMKK